ncbi:MAG: hypothetical protein AB7Q92_13935 [Acidimicrobiia bacterium]
MTTKLLGRASRLCLFICLLGASLVALPAVTPAGAQAIVPCPNGVNGWFNSRQGAVNCTWQGNHIVVDYYSPGGAYYLQGVIDIWHPSACTPIFYNNYFVIQLVNTNSGEGCGVATYPYTYAPAGVAVPWGTHTWVYSGPSYYYKYFHTSGYAVNPFRRYILSTYCQGSTANQEGFVGTRPNGTNGSPYTVMPTVISAGAPCIGNGGDTFVMIDIILGA